LILPPTTKRRNEPKYDPAFAAAAALILIVILSEAKNLSWIAAIEEGFFASLRMTIRVRGAIAGSAGIPELLELSQLLDYTSVRFDASSSAIKSK
jgi:hypothetical protein